VLLEPRRARRLAGLLDVRNEVVSIQQAREAYGVVADPKALVVDAAATEALRAERVATNGDRG